MASREVVDLEAQLRRYADQVEGAVSEVALGAAPARRRSPLLAVAAVLALVAAIGVVFALSRPDSSSTVDTDPSEDGAPIGGDADDDAAADPEQPGPEPEADDDGPPYVSQMPSFDPDAGPGELGADGWLPERALIDPGPLSPRSSPLIVPLDREVLVWGGSIEASNVGRPDLEWEQFADGAIFDLTAGAWRMMAPSPIPPSQFRGAAVWIDDRLLFTRGTSSAYYDPLDDEWSAPAVAPIVLDELDVSVDGVVAGWSDEGAALFEAGEWRRIDDAGPRSEFNTFTDYAWLGDRLVAVRHTIFVADLPGFVVEAWDSTIGTWVDVIEIDVPGAMFFDVHRIDDETLAVFAENGRGLVVESSGTWRELPSLDRGGWEGQPQLTAGPSPGGPLWVRYAPEFHRFDGQSWWSFALPQGSYYGTFDRSNGILWTYGIRSGDVGGGNYFAAVSIPDLVAVDVPAETAGSDETVSVPSVVALFADTAIASLRNTGLEPVTEFVAVPFGDPQVGVVISQSPVGFTEVGPGTQVVIAVGEAGPNPDQ